MKEITSQNSEAWLQNYFNSEMALLLVSESLVISFLSEHDLSELAYA